MRNIKTLLAYVVFLALLVTSLAADALTVDVLIQSYYQINTAIGHIQLPGASFRAQIPIRDELDRELFITGLGEMGDVRPMGGIVNVIDGQTRRSYEETQTSVDAMKTRVRTVLANARAERNQIREQALEEARQRRYWEARAEQQRRNQNGGGDGCG